MWPQIWVKPKLFIERMSTGGLRISPIGAYVKDSRFAIQLKGLLRPLIDHAAFHNGRNSIVVGRDVISAKIWGESWDWHSSLGSKPTEFAAYKSPRLSSQTAHAPQR